jgi:uncharacterized membrane protein YdjX (TVP38/TMEM64 family)
LLDGLKKFGLASLIGVLIGILLTSWANPTTDGGVQVLITIPVIVCLAIGGIIALFTKKKEDKKDETKTEDDDTKGETTS